MRNIRFDAGICQKVPHRGGVLAKGGGKGMKFDIPRHIGLMIPINDSVKALAKLFINPIKAEGRAGKVVLVLCCVW